MYKAFRQMKKNTVNQENFKTEVMWRETVLLQLC